MNLWTSPETIPPEVELLVRRWRLPTERIEDVKLLLAAQKEGGTACSMTGPATNSAAAWGVACQIIRQTDSPNLVRPPSPLVVRQHAGTTHLQSWRFFQAEQFIARDLLARAVQPAPVLARPVAELLADLGKDQINSRQEQAIHCALNHSLALITGGPGTGKTHTLARLLALLIGVHPGANPVIRLAAPTGKAAERMKEAVEAATAQLQGKVSDAVFNRLKITATGATTVHKLLGFNPGSGSCHHNAGNQLGCDVLIVDECSMVDTLMWQALLAALPVTTRLILLGDPNQLESVSAGDVLGSLVRQARSQPRSPLGRVWTELTESIRFNKHPGIGALAQAVVNLHAAEAVDLLTTHAICSTTARDDGLVWLGDHGGRFNWERLPAPVHAALAAVADAPTPTAALAALSGVRLLTAHRENTLGVSGINAAIERQLRHRTSDSDPTTVRQPNQPVIINQNDAETGLTNGSVGIIMTGSDGVRAAFFPAGSAQLPPRRVPLGQLPDHGTAWAMTIHRSQGSEFNQVVVILPPDESPLATRELIYTGITRAKDCVHVWGSEDTLRTALGDRALRCTLLEASLQQLG